MTTPFPEIGKVQPVETGDYTPAGRPTITRIKYAVRQVFNLNEGDLECKRRFSALARPRQAAYLACQQLTTASFPRIGRHFGYRDHTTIMYGVKKARERMTADEQYAAQVEAVIRIARERA